MCLGSSKVTKSPQSRWQQAPILYSSGEFLPLQMSKPAGAARMVKQPPQQQRGEGGENTGRIVALPCLCTTRKP